MLRASVVLDKDVITDLLGFSDVNSYAIANYGKPLSQHTSEQQKIIRQEFDEYFRENKVRLFETARVYNALSERFAERLNQKEQELSKISADDTPHGIYNTRNPQKILLSAVYCSNFRPSSDTNGPAYLPYPPGC